MNLLALKVYMCLCVIVCWLLLICHLFGSIHAVASKMNGEFEQILIARAYREKLE